MRQRLVSSICVLLVLVTSACGGESGDDDDDQPDIDAGPSADAATPDAAMPDAATLDAAICPFGIDDTFAARLAVTTDDNARLFVNGALVDDTPYLWSNPQVYDVALYRHPSRENIIAIEAINTQVINGPDRGTLADVRWTIDEASHSVITDDAWAVSAVLETGWEEPGFDASGWSAAVEVANHGDSPWGFVLDTLAPGTTARWIWSYDSDMLAADKPVTETVWTRRVFYVDLLGAPSTAPTACP